MGGTVKNTRGLQGAQRLLICQLSITVLLMAIAVCFSSAAALSTGLGGLVSIVPTAHFARKIFQHQGAHAARQIVNSFYKGEALKLILTIALFALVFKFFNIVPLVFFAAYMMVQMVFWFAPLIFK